jgi:hypothetical protein
MLQQVKPMEDLWYAKAAIDSDIRKKTEALVVQSS